jgi:uncharacterized repeat protein (TIGR02543 family)
MLKLSLNYNINATISDSFVWFVLPRAATWRPVLNGTAATISTNIAASGYSFCTTTETISGAQAISAGTGLLSGISGSPSFGAPGATFTPSENITAIGVKFAELKQGDSFTLLFPVKLPQVDGSTVAYDTVAEGRTIYLFNDSTPETQEGGVPALKLVQSDEPTLMGPPATAGAPAQAIPASASLDYGAALPEWWRIVTYDDVTPNVQAASIKVEFVPFGQTVDSKQTLLAPGTAYTHESGYTPAGSTVAGSQGYFNIADPTSIISSIVPGTYTITYTTGNDWDAQSGSVVRVLEIDDQRFSVIYRANGGTGAVPTDTGRYYGGSAVNVKYDSVPTYADHSFTGWNTASNGTGATFVKGDSGASVILTLQADTMLYAQWAPDEYIITYDLDGGFNAEGNPTGYDADNALPLPVSAPSKYGYVFQGWLIDYKNAAFTDVVSPVAAYEIPASAKGDIELSVAFWQPKSVAVAFYSNLGAGDTRRFAPGDEVNANRRFDDLLVAPASEPERTGYRFNGWYSARTGGAAWDFASERITTEGSLSLFAQWQANSYPYTVEHYRVNSAGTVLVDKDALSAPYDTTVQAQAKNYVGYHHDLSHSQGLTEGAISADGDLTLRLYYRINNYIVRFTDGQSTILSAQSVEHGGNAVAPATPSRAGYGFQGWDRAFDDVTSDVTISALWQLIVVPPPKAYALAYVGGATVSGMGGATGVSGLPAGGRFEAGTAIAAGGAPAREGYRFVGWSSSEGATLQPGTSFVMPARDVTLTALWQVLPVAGEGDVLVVAPVVSAPADETSPEPEQTASDEDAAAISSDTDTSDDVTPDAMPTAVTPPVPQQTALSAVEGLSSAEVALIANQTGNPLADIASGNVPLGNLTVAGAWSLLSLLLAMLVGLSVIALLLSGVMGRRRAGVLGAGANANASVNAGVGLATGGTEQVLRATVGKGAAGKGPRLLPLKVFAVIVGALAVVTWLILDDPTLPMVWINANTAYVALLLAVHFVLSLAYTLIRRKRHGDDTGETRANSADSQQWQSA